MKLGKYAVFLAEYTTTGKVSRDGILPELPSYRLPGRFSVRPALRTQGEKGNGHGSQLNSFLKCLNTRIKVGLLLYRPSEMTRECNLCFVLRFGDIRSRGDFLQ